MTKRTAQTEKPTLSSELPGPTPPIQPPADAPAVAQDSGRKPFEDYFVGLPAWKVAALKASTRWPQGREVTQEEFEQALEAATGEVIQ